MLPLVIVRALPRFCVGRRTRGAAKSLPDEHSRRDPIRLKVKCDVDGCGSSTLIDYAVSISIETGEIVLPTEDPKKRVLLLSNSIHYGRGYLDHAETEIRNLFGSRKRVLFVPFAMFDRDSYANKNRTRLAAMGYNLESIHTALDARSAVENAEAVFIGGGNTFRLLKTLYDQDLLGVIRKRVEEGMPYLGSSAGSVVACPTLKTTNDMPVVQPPSFAALNIVSFQINAHYVDPDPSSTHMGETREERLLQYLEDNDIPVVALREGAMVNLDGGVVTLKGISGARIFRPGVQPEEVPARARVSR